MPNGNGNWRAIEPEPIVLGPLVFKVQILDRQPEGIYAAVKINAPGETELLWFSTVGQPSWTTRDFISTALENLVQLAEEPDALYNKMVDQMREDIEAITGHAVPDESFDLFYRIFYHDAEWAKRHLNDILEARKEFLAS